MRLAALALLLGAAPLQQYPADIAPAATCSLDQPRTEAAFRTLVDLGSEDDTEDDERGTITAFAGADIWGQPTKVAFLYDYARPAAGEHTQRYETRFIGEAADARARLFAAHGKATCDREAGGVCELTLAPAGEWRRSVSLTTDGTSMLVLTCTFKKGG